MIRESADEGSTTRPSSAPRAQARTMYRRTLPPGLIPFSSDDGRALFGQALTAGTMEGYFALAEQFHTQSEPSFCGLGTLVIVLNALAIDPGRTWKGSWRWFAEDMLDCCRPLDEIKTEGITLSEFVCLARCNGAHAEASRPQASSLETFRREVHEVTSGADRGHLVVAYDRATLGESGAGHFSPVGGYHAGRDLVLLLDVARFKYPPHWVPLERLWEAMAPLDPSTGKSRGFIRLTRGDVPTPTLCNLATEKCAWNAAVLAVLQAHTARSGSRWALDALAPSALAALTTPRQAESDAHRREREELLAEIRATALFAQVGAAVPAPLSPEIVTVLVLAAPDELVARLSPEATAELTTLRRAAALPDRLRAEVDAVRSQLTTLVGYCRTG
jgi:glutathione gamma-glutamylcysteinyltransferase